MEESYIIANRTDVGKVRSVNEDSMVTFDSPNGRVIAVCDGMGGQAAGDVASKLACDIIADILTNNKFDTPTEAITRACIAANQGIVHKAAQNPNLEGMGATCVMVIIKDGLAYYGWVGDSRIYYISNHSIQQLTRDQSYVQQLVDQGQITAAEAAHHPQKNQILNALGLPSMTPPELCTAPLTPQPGSILLLCSDGLSGMVDDNTILNIVSQKDLSLQKRADTLVDRAIANGGNDNITVQLVQFGKNARSAAAAPRKQQTPNMMLWGIILGAVIVAAIVFFCIFTGKEEKKTEKTGTSTESTTAPVKSSTTTTPAVSTPSSSSPSPSSHQPAPKTTYKPTQPSTTNPAPKNKNTSSPKTGTTTTSKKNGSPIEGTTGKKVDQTGADKFNKGNSGSGNNASKTDVVNFDDLKK